MKKLLLQFVDGSKKDIIVKETYYDDNVVLPNKGEGIIIKGIVCTVINKYFNYDTDWAETMVSIHVREVS